MNVPREIDQLMWEIADAKDATIESQFIARYPIYAGELDKRKKMVGDLKGSRPSMEPALFVPSREVRNFGPSKLAVVAASATVIASLAFATYATSRFLESRRVDDPIVSPTKIAQDLPKQFQQPEVEDPAQTSRSISDATGSLPADPVVPQQTSAYLAKISVRSEKASLIDVINEIASQSGISLTIAPGFEDRMIFILYQDQPAIGVLNDLGRRYGFTAFQQGKSEVLIIPARGSGSINETGADGVANEIKGSKMEHGEIIEQS